MSGVMRPARREDLPGLWQTVAEAHLFTDVDDFERWWHEGEWRVQVSDRGAAVVGRWREHLPYLAILGLWCPRSEITGALGSLQSLAREQGFTRVVGPLAPEESVRPYSAAGFAVEERIVVCRRVIGPLPEEPSVRGVTLRSGGPEDVPALVALDARCFADFWRYDGSTLGVLAAAGDLLVAESEGTPIGYTLWVLSGAEATIARLAVDPDHRRRGVGSALVREAIAGIAGAGARAVTLTTQEENRISRALYRREGFRESPGRLVCTISQPLGGAGQADGRV